jgi:hypothetical protein
MNEKTCSRRKFFRRSALTIAASTILASELPGDVVKNFLDIDNQLRLIETEIHKLSLRDRITNLTNELSLLGLTTLPNTLKQIDYQCNLFDERKHNYQSRSGFIPLQLNSIVHRILIDESHAFFDPQQRMKAAKKVKRENEAGKENRGDNGTYKYYPIPENNTYTITTAKKDPSRYQDSLMYDSSGSITREFPGLKYGSIPSHADKFLSQRARSMYEITEAMFGTSYAVALLRDLHIGLRASLFTNDIGIYGTTDAVHGTINIIDSSGIALFDYGPHEAAHLLGIIATLKYRYPHVGSLEYLPLEFFLTVADCLPDIIKEIDAHPDLFYTYHGFDSSLEKFLRQFSQRDPNDFGGIEKLRLVEQKIPYMTSVPISSLSIQANEFFKTYRQISKELTGTKFSTMVEDLFWNHVEEICAQGVMLTLAGMLAEESPRYAMTFNLIKILNPEGTNDPGWLGKLQSNTLVKDVKASIEYIENDPILGKNALYLLHQRVHSILTQPIGEPPSPYINMTKEDYNKWHRDISHFVTNYFSNNKMWGDPAAFGVFYHLGVRETINYLYNSPAVDAIFPILLGISSDEWKKMKANNKFIKPPNIKKLVLNHNPQYLTTSSLT